MDLAKWCLSRSFGQRFVYFQCQASIRCLPLVEIGRDD